MATAKHVFHDLAFDRPDKDSWRHIDAGSKATIIGSADKLILIKPIKDGAKVEDVLQILGESYDIILIEGFKQSSVPKIEVHRKEVGPPLKSLSNLVAIATDEPLLLPVKQFILSDAQTIADFIETTFIPRSSDTISVYVNNKPVKLSAFRANLLTNILEAVISSLKHKVVIETMEILLRKRRRR